MEVLDFTSKFLIRANPQLNECGHDNFCLYPRLVRVRFPEIATRIPHSRGEAELSAARPLGSVWWAGWALRPQLGPKVEVPRRRE